MHRILARQIKRHLGESSTDSPELKAFFESVSKTYTDFDDDQTLLNRSLDLSSKEFQENNRRLEEVRLKVEDQAKNLANQVAKRTEELDKRVSELEDVRSAMSNLLEDFAEKQKALAEAKVKDEAILGSIADGCIVVNEKGEIILINQMAQKLLGYQNSESIGKPWFEILHREDEAGNLILPEKGAIFAALSTSISKKGKTYTISESKILPGNYFYVRKNKTKFPVAITVAPVILENKIVGAVEVFQDISDRKKEEERLIKEKNKVAALAKDLEKFKLAVDNVSDQVMITDPEGIVIYANPAVEKNIGYKLKEVFGRKAGTLRKKPMPKEYYHNFWHTIKTEKKTFIGEIQNKRKNGEIYTAAISVSPVLDKSGKIIFFVGIERDITKEKEIDKAKTEFVSTASHALRTPLTAIDGLVSMILDGEYGKINNNLKQPLKDVNTSSERLINLVNDLLNLSRIQAGRMKYTLSEFSIEKVVKEAVHLLKPIAEQKGLELSVSCLEENMVQGDKDKVQQILNNLIGNSLKFTDKGNITVSAKTVGDRVEVYIIDTGIGIARSDQDKLFGLFEQLESGKGRTVGTGLGLHISKKMTRDMGGDVWLKSSEVGKGSTFAFSVPLVNSIFAKQIKAKNEKEIKVHSDQKSDATVHSK